MRSLACYALGLCTAAALLAACGGSPGASSLSIAPAALAQRLARGPGEVQYVSYYAGLLEFDYPKSVSPIGSIGFNAGSECTSGAKTFWTASTDEIAEFAVGGTSPIRTLEASASGCAIDPATGDLAATVLGNGGVIIFHKSRGKGKVVASQGETYFDGYDTESNLFVDGFRGSDTFTLSELRKGGRTFEIITTSNTIEFPGSVQWDGKYLTVFDQMANAIYRYSVSGAKATLKGTVALSGASDCAQTWIAPPYVYCADAGNDEVGVYPYPAGGTQIATLGGSFSNPLGVVSLRVR